MKSLVPALSVLAAVAFIPAPAPALTMEQFLTICHSRPGAECETHPVLQAYVGGSLDMIAMLDEETDYLKEVYCANPKTLFDVNKIIQFMEDHAQDHGDRNAMLLVIRYLEERGGCR